MTFKLYRTETDGSTYLTIELYNPTRRMSIIDPLEQELRKKSIKEQRSILRTWDDEPEIEEKKLQCSILFEDLSIADAYYLDVDLLPNGSPSAYYSYEAMCNIIRNYNRMVSPMTRNPFKLFNICSYKKLLEYKSTIAGKFRYHMRTVLDNSLEQAFPKILTEEVKSDIIDRFESLPKPILHKELDELLSTINNMQYENVNSQRGSAIKILKSKAESAYEENDLSFEDEYKVLHKNYQEFLALDEKEVKNRGKKSKWILFTLLSIISAAASFTIKFCAPIIGLETKLANIFLLSGVLFSLFYFVVIYKIFIENQQICQLMKKDIIARTAANTLINHDKPNQGNTEAKEPELPPPNPPV